MLIGLVGFIGSGKGTVANFLVKKHGFTKISFAEPIKDAAAMMFNWPRPLLEGDTEESRKFRETKDGWWSEKFGHDFSPRHALQLLGTEAGRNVFHEDVWIYSVFRRMFPGKNYVISDVRFPNEIKFISEQKGFIVRVRRGDDPEWYNTALKENNTSEDDHWLLEDAGELMEQKYPDIHISEWNWIGSPTHHLLVNDGPLNMLETDITHMIRVFEGTQKA